MITIKYKDDMGDVQASFDSLAEYEKFRDEFILKEKARKAEQIAKIKSAQEEAAKKATAQREELRKLIKDLTSKAISYGITPSEFVDFIRESMLSAMRDYCKRRNEDDSDCSQDQDWDADGANNGCDGVDICLG